VNDGCASPPTTATPRRYVLPGPRASISRPGVSQLAAGEQAGQASPHRAVARQSSPLAWRRGSAWRVTTLRSCMPRRQGEVRHRSGTRAPSAPGPRRTSWRDGGLRAVPWRQPRQAELEERDLLGRCCGRGLRERTAETQVGLPAAARKAVRPHHRPMPAGVVQRQAAGTVPSPSASRWTRRMSSARCAVSSSSEFEPTARPVRSWILASR